MLLALLLSRVPVVRADEGTVGGTVAVAEADEDEGIHLGSGIHYSHRTYRPQSGPRRHEVKVERQTADLTVLVSTPLVTAPMAEFQAELKVDPRVGLALHGGVGGYMGLETWSIGAAGRGYVAGVFDRGVFLGLDVRYTNNAFPDRAEPALAIGPVFGAKYAFDIPLTVEAKVGVGYVQGNGWAGISPSATAGIGWSF